jgi:hypothetical protein
MTNLQPVWLFQRLWWQQQRHQRWQKQATASSAQEALCAGQREARTTAAWGERDGSARTAQHWSIRKPTVVECTREPTPFVANASATRASLFLRAVIFLVAHFLVGCGNACSESTVFSGDGGALAPISPSPVPPPLLARAVLLRDPPRPQPIHLPAGMTCGTWAVQEGVHPANQRARSSAERQTEDRRTPCAHTSSRGHRCSPAARPPRRARWVGPVRRFRSRSSGNLELGRAILGSFVHPQRKQHERKWRNPMRHSLLQREEIKIEQ